MDRKEYEICNVETILLYFFVRKSLPYVIVDTMLCQLMNKEPGTIHTEYTFSENFPGIVQLFRKFSRQSTAFQKVFHYRVQFFRLFSIKSTVFQNVFQKQLSWSFPNRSQFFKKFSRQITVFQKVFQTENSFSECLIFSVQFLVF